MISSGEFEGSRFYLFEANEAVHILIDKSVRRDGIVLRLCRLCMRLGSGPLHEKTYVVKDMELDQVLNESLPIPTALATSFTCEVELGFRKCDRG